MNPNQSERLSRSIQFEAKSNKPPTVGYYNIINL